MKSGEQPRRPSAKAPKADPRMRYRLRRRHYLEMSAFGEDRAESGEASIAHVLAEREQQLAKLSADAATWRDTALRARAELENARKRFQREKADTIQFATESLIKELIPVVDNLERALASTETTDDPKAIHQGVLLLRDQFVGILRANGLELIAPDGQAFDPHFHDAVSAEEREDIEDNTVVGTFQKGYILRGRVVRPAMVRVGRLIRPPAPAETAGTPAAGEDTLADIESLPPGHGDDTEADTSDNSGSPA